MPSGWTRWLLEQFEFPFQLIEAPALDKGELRDKLDPKKSNAGVLLGLRGVVVKSHGGADAEGFAYAVDVGYEMVRYDLLTKINQMLNRDGAALAAVPTSQEAVS